MINLCRCQAGDNGENTRAAAHPSALAVPVCLEIRETRISVIVVPIQAVHRRLRGICTRAAAHADISIAPSNKGVENTHSMNLELTCRPCEIGKASMGARG